MEWEAKQEWRAQGENYLVTVNHWTDEIGENKWNVYAYIYPKHRMFGMMLAATGILHDAPNSLPLHCGCSLLRRHYSDGGECSSVQVGSDYNHLGDEYFSRLATKDEAVIVFQDAERLFEALK